ncbi:MAG: hypothetical protein LBK95_00295 [Bifidobacteriaceae bacterium]|jgi:plasmid stability protein|nr:hypothetical protein [Bifidobacteriaceae bacterium]
MATLTVRDLAEPVYEGLKGLAHRNGRSMEAEARTLLAESVRASTWWEQWVAAVAPATGDELPIPPRTPPRGIDL